MVCKSDASQCTAVLSPSQSCWHGLWFASLMLHSALPFCYPPNLAASREEFPQLRNALGLVLPAPMEPGKMVWQVYEGRGRWRDLPSALNFVVEQACVDGQGGVHYVWPPNGGGDFATQYTIDLLPCCKPTTPPATSAKLGTSSRRQWGQTALPRWASKPRTNKSRQKRRPPSVTLPILLSWFMVCKSDASQCTAVLTPSQSCCHGL